MAYLTISPVSSLRGVLTVPGDKSISHRALLFSALSQGTSRITHCLQSGDLSTTRRALEALGVVIEEKDNSLEVHGRGLEGLRASSIDLDMGNSGTTTRLLLGILAGQPFSATLIGDDSLSKRPMTRVTHFLEEMGAKIQWGKNGKNFLPLTITGRKKLKPIDYNMTVPSAQVKSAILLAGLSAESAVSLTEIIPTRDHTERLLKFCGADLVKDGNKITLSPGGKLTAKNLTVPGDISSAAFFLAGGIIVPNSSVTVRNVGLNPTRTGFLDLLKRMGATVETTFRGGEDWEPFGDITVRFGSLKGIIVTAEEIPSLIDELPILMVAATQANGQTLIKGAGELRVKETDRIYSMVTGLSAMGASIHAEEERVVIEGPTPLKGARVQSFGDHRTAMALAIAGLVAEGATVIEGSEWIDISFPGFAQVFAALRQTP